MISGASDEGEPVRTIAFRQFPHDEQEDFESSCKRWRKSPEEFEVTAEEGDIPSGGIAAIQRDVIVVHAPSGRARRYEAGYGTNWNAKFEDDLQALYFN